MNKNIWTNFVVIFYADYLFDSLDGTRTFEVNKKTKTIHGLTSNYIGKDKPQTVAPISTCVATLVQDTSETINTDKKKDGFGENITSQHHPYKERPEVFHHMLDRTVCAVESPKVSLTLQNNGIAAISTVIERISPHVPLQFALESHGIKIGVDNHTTKHNNTEEKPVEVLFNFSQKKWSEKH